MVFTSELFSNPCRYCSRSLSTIGSKGLQTGIQDKVKNELHRRQPRLRAIHRHHTSLEIRKLIMVIGNMADLIRLIRNLPSPSTHKKQRLTLLLMSMSSTVFLVHIPRLTDDTDSPRKGPSDFEEIQFKDHFRFRKQDFYRVLCV